MRQNTFHITKFPLAILAVALAACGPESAVDRIGFSVTPGTGGSGDLPDMGDDGTGGTGGSAGGTGGSTGGAGGSTGGSGGSTGGAGGSTGGAGGSTGGVGGSTGGAGGSTGGVGGSTGGVGGSTGGVGGSTGGVGGSTGGAGGGPQMRQALLVVADPNLSASDARLKAMIEVRGYTVTAVDDAAAADTSGAQLVVVSSTSVSGTVAAKYRDVTVPVISLEASILDDMKMTGPTKTMDYDEDQATQIVIRKGQEGHPLAAGLSDTVTIVTGQPAGCCGVNWGKPANTAVSIATFPGVGGRTTIFAYERGVVMADGFTAPHRRIGFFAAETSIQYLNADGQRLLGEAIKWAER